jgi:hypothetical protein
MDLIIKKGTELYHATGEPFDAKTLRTGLYDDILWTTTEPAISQTYIPVAGSEVYCNTESFLRPTKDEVFTKFQKEVLGLEYDQIEWGAGGRATSYRIVKNPFKEFDNKEHEYMYGSKKDSEVYYRAQKDKNAVVNNILINQYGYTPKHKSDFDNNYEWKIKLKGNEIMKADYRAKGRLFILVPNSDLKIYDNTKGGRIEGDLTNVEYHSHDLFSKVKESGYDGIKINDFAQSNDLGNFGHTSIGLFQDTIKKLHSEVIEDVMHHDLDPIIRKGWDTGKRDWNTPEYKKYRGLDEIRKIVREGFARRMI